MARWKRALTILRQRVPEGERVLDLGCGVGIGTAKFARHYDTYALDDMPEHLMHARVRAPQAHFMQGVGEHLPYPDAYFAAVTLLDVLEHVADERAVVQEIGRVLRPGGLLLLSVPQAGLLRWYDSLNLYAWLTGEHPLAPPGTSSDSFRYHRHYSLRALTGLLGDRFVIDYTHYSALGLAEFIHLFGLLIGKRLLRRGLLYWAIFYVYIGAHVVEDILSLNEKGYYIMIAARRTTS